VLREEHKLRVYENRELRRIFEPKHKEITEDQKKMCNEDLHDLSLTKYYLHDQL
jgi:hypothetical protein